MKIDSIVEEIEKRNLKRHGHLIMMNYERKTKQVYEARTDRTRRRGRTRKEWEQYVGNIARDTEMELKTREGEEENFIFSEAIKSV